MNRLEFLARKAAARLGVVAPRHYLRTATEESILLKEAETLIGKMAWRELEHVEELTNEYWRIRQLDTEQAKLQGELEEAKAELHQKQEQAEVPETAFSQSLARVESSLESEREALATKLQAMQQLIHQAEGVRKKFNGLKLKLTVLKGEQADDATLAAVRADLQTAKNTYGDLAREVENIRSEVQLAEDKIKGIESEEDILRGRISRRERNLTREVAEVSRRVIEINSRLGILEGEKSELFVTIGRLLRAHRDEESREYREVLERYSPIIDRARSLSRSIDYNRRLADYR